jgi:hypothetical protein
VAREASDKPLPSWEHIFDLRTSSAAEVNTSILSSVFRREPWLSCAGLLRMSGSPMVSAADKSLDDLFPHVKVLAHAMIGRPGWYIGEPCTLMGHGGQEWISDWPAIAVVGTNEAMVLYERLGIEPARMRRLWRSHFSRAVEFMPVIGAHRRAPSMRDFPWGAYVWRNRWRIDILGAVVLRSLHPGTWLKARVPAPLFAARRAVWRSGRRLAGRRAPGQAL